jgi:hypothetical protein
MRPGVNIWSGARGDQLAAALTNPTALARRKGNLDRDYPVTVDGVVYEDAEAAYHALKPHSGHIGTVARVVALKLEQHPHLARWIEARGGRDWLMTCSHHTGARSARFQWWEGDGLDSPFITALVRGCEDYLASTTAR